MVASCAAADDLQAAQVGACQGAEDLEEDIRDGVAAASDRFVPFSGACQDAFRPEEAHEVPLASSGAHGRKREKREAFDAAAFPGAAWAAFQVLEGRSQEEEDPSFVHWVQLGHSAAADAFDEVALQVEALGRVVRNAAVAAEMDAAVVEHWTLVVGLAAARPLERQS